MNSGSPEGMHSQQSWQRILCFWACSQKCSVALTAIPEIQPLLNCLSSWVTAETLKNSWIKPSKTLPKYHETLNWFVNCFRELILCGGGKRLKSRVPWQNNCRRTNKGKQICLVCHFFLQPVMLHTSHWSTAYQARWGAQGKPQDLFWY